MSAPGPGEYIPPRRIEEGDPVLYCNGDERERGRVVSVDHASDLQLASISIYSDERIEADVQFGGAGRGYVYDSEVPEAGEL